MIEVAPRLYVGNQLDEKKVSGKAGWAILHCAKEPYHREMVGYSARSLDRLDPEYLVALRTDRMALNMIDAPKPEFFAPKMVQAGLDFIRISLSDGKNVLVHCNQGGSRGPIMAMLYLAPAMPEDFEAAEEALRALYPNYTPGAGFRAFAQAHWNEYRDAAGQARPSDHDG